MSSGWRKPGGSSRRRGSGVCRRWRALDSDHLPFPALVFTSQDPLAWHAFVNIASQMASAKGIFMTDDAPELEVRDILRRFRVEYSRGVRGARHDTACWCPPGGAATGAPRAGRGTAIGTGAGYWRALATVGFSWTTGRLGQGSRRVAASSTLSRLGRSLALPGSWPVSRSAWNGGISTRQSADRPGGRARVTV